MNTVTTHVCIVSGQPAPNLLPLLDEAMRPDRVVLLVTLQMREKAEWLKAVIKPMGIKVEFIELEVAENFNAIQAKLLSLLDNVDCSTVALNATGGTKWMAIAAQEVFRLHDAPVFYVNIINDTVLFLDEKKQPHKLQHRINLDKFLKANGYKVISGGVPQGLPESDKKMCEQLVLKVAQWSSAIGQLNQLASIAGQQKSLQISMDLLNGTPDAHLLALMAELRTAGILNSSDPHIVRFSNEASRSYANGGWLEFYVNSLLNRLKVDGVIQDSARLNLKISSSKDSQNELDVAFMANNHLHIIECKTKRMSGSDMGAAVTDSLYKLDSISDLGGLGTKAMLVSYRELRATDKQRATDLRIKVVAGIEIQNLKSHLKKWIQS